MRLLSHISPQTDADSEGLASPLGQFFRDVPSFHNSFFLGPLIFSIYTHTQPFRAGMWNLALQMTPSPIIPSKYRQRSEMMGNVVLQHLQGQRLSAHFLF